MCLLLFLSVFGAVRFQECRGWLCRNTLRVLMLQHGGQSSPPSAHNPPLTQDENAVSTGYA